MKRARVLLIVGGGFAIGAATNSIVALVAWVFITTAATERRLWLRLAPRGVQTHSEAEPVDSKEVLLRFVWVTWPPVAITGFALVLNGSPLGAVPLVVAAGLAVVSRHARPPGATRRHLSLAGALVVVLLLAAAAQRL